MRDVELTTHRLEALSDGVFAIAITLLILQIRVPSDLHDSHGALAAALRRQWPSYFAYVLSFTMIGIYWVNHHYLFRLYRRTDHAFNLLNILFLMCISFLPFPTAVLGENVGDMSNRHTAVSLYAFGLLLPAFSWLLCWVYASRGGRLIDPRLEPAFTRHLTRQYILSNALYLGALLISFLNAVIAMVIVTGLALFYMLPAARPAYRSEPAHGAGAREG